MSEAPEKIWATLSTKSFTTKEWVAKDVLPALAGEDDIHEYTRSDRVPQWQPIETAPKDGSVFMGWLPPEDGELGECTIARWSGGSGVLKDIQAWRDEWGMAIGDLSHWQPLPEPPA